MIEALLLLIVLVHLHLHYRVWVRREVDVFAKYRDDGTDPMVAAKWAYLCKATWLVLLLVLLYFGTGFADALVYSFAAYSLLVLLLLSRNRYTVAQCALAFACLGLRLWGRSA